MRRQLLCDVSGVCAVAPSEGPEQAIYCFNGLVHRLFDDTPIAERPLAAVGLFLLDKAEAEKARDLVVAIEMFLEETDSEEEDEAGSLLFLLDSGHRVRVACEALARLLSREKSGV